MTKSYFKILKKDKKTKARLGILSTPHGNIQTPSYVFVGTYGKIRHLTPKDIKRTKTQFIIANTFHLWKEASQGPPLQQGRSLLIKKLGLTIPTMTDSGGFQVLSLAFDNKNRVGKFMKDPPRRQAGGAKKDTAYKRTKIKISAKGVHFLFNGKWRFLGPELSMKLQQKIGADIIFAFDHITSPLDDYEYNKKAVVLTDKWALRCLKANKNKNQALFGIVQGGLFKDLRIKSAKSIGSMPFDGFGIGGSYTKKQISKILKWIIPYLPEEKPRHLLGVGKVADIFEAIQNGIDTFDCVIPTREARHGRLYTKTGHMDIRKGKYVSDKKVIEKGCGCLTCSAKISRSKIRELIKSDLPIRQAQGQRYALMHNMWFFNNMIEEICESIKRNRFKKFKNSFLRRFESK
ncbi:MAG: tRNA guanosine(34) transglycosylase Tgt [Candidatus Yanofskybacteria bacterium]|nr:tRNA guanosine(34) transglycosylase Tgt [Candidatus Yanofskybacteria bacterium]